MKTWNEIHNAFDQAMVQFLDQLFDGQPSVVVNTDDFSRDDAAEEAEPAIERSIPAYAGEPATHRRERPPVS